MNKISLIILSIFLGLVIFIIGCGVGIMYQTEVKQNINGDSGIIQNNIDCKTLIRALSKTIVSISAFGKVTNIDNKNITLETGEQSLTIKLIDSVLVNSFVSRTEKLSEQNSSFNQIKLGDIVSVRLGLSINGELEGLLVTIYPSSILNQ